MCGAFRISTFRSRDRPVRLIRRGLYGKNNTMRTHNNGAISLFLSFERPVREQVHSLLRERLHELTRLSSRTLPLSLFFYRFYLSYCVFHLARVKRKKERESGEREGGKKEVRGTAGRIWGPPTVWWADASLQQSRRDRCLPSRTIALFLPSRLYAGASSMLQPDGCNFGRCVSAVNRARCSRHQQRWLLCHWEKLISARVIDWFLQLSWYIFIVLLISSNFLHVDINYIINIVKFIRKSEVNSLWNILNIKLTRGIWHLFLHAIHYTVCVCVAGVGYRIARLERAS